MIKEAPKTIKYGRVFRLKMGNEIKKSNLNLNVYKYGIKALESGWLDSKQLNSILRLIKVILKKDHELRLNCSLIIPITKKPLETRMGSGKGERKFWKSPIKNGMIILEFGKLSFDEVWYIYNILSRRLPFLVKLVKMVY